MRIESYRARCAICHLNLLRKNELIVRFEKASREDFPSIQAVELASFLTLQDAGGISGEATASSTEELEHYLKDELLFAAFDEKNQVVGFAGATVSDDSLHLGEIDVHPALQKRGIGRLLLTSVVSEGKKRNLYRVTLTTDRFVPFNAPFYASCGFSILEADECSQRLKDILESEKECGFDPLRRVAMQFVY